MIRKQTDQIIIVEQNCGLVKITKMNAIQPSDLNSYCVCSFCDETALDILPCIFKNTIRCTDGNSPLSP